jgi:hypothetical protein
MLKAAAPDVTVERVEVDLRGGDTVVWSWVGDEDESKRRVYVMTPGRMQAVTFEYFTSRGTLCMAHLADWQSVAEHTLG